MTWLEDVGKKGGDWFTRMDPAPTKEDNKAKDYLWQTGQDWDALQVPELQDLDPAKYAYLGDYTPDEFKGPADLQARGVMARPGINWSDADAENAALTKMGRSAFEGVSTDPALRQRQMQALGSLDEIVDGGGLTMRDRANLQKIRSDVATADRGRRDAILQNMSARGMGGSGMELLAQLQSNQAASDRESQAGLDQAAMAEERALQALMQQGQMAGSLRDQDFGEQARIAAAQDAINQFNASAANSMSQFNTGQRNDMARFNKQGAIDTRLADRNYATGVDQWNAGATNDMAQYNQGKNIQIGLANTGFRNDAKAAGHKAQQDLANANVDTANKAQQYNKVDKPLAQHQMAVDRLQGKSGSNSQLSNYWTGRADRKANASSMGTAGGAKVATSYFMGGGDKGSTSTSDERAKEGIDKITDADIDEFLAALEPKSYRYKKGKGDGDPQTKAGFVLQDVQGTKLGDMMTRENEDGLAYDKQSLDGVILAALKKLSKGA